MEYISGLSLSCCETQRTGFQHKPAAQIDAEDAVDSPRPRLIQRRGPAVRARAGCKGILRVGKPWNEGFNNGFVAKNEGNSQYPPNEFV